MPAPVHALSGAYCAAMPRAAAARRSPVAQTSLWSLVLRWMSTRRQREALTRLDRRLLSDIGVTPDAAAREAARPFWDV